ncbi:MAG: cytochrome c biogenesis protein ResB, partial [bacterium]
MKKALDVLSSRRVSVYLFLILLFVSLLGALIPQKELPAYYEAHYRPWAVTFLNAFQLTDIYHAWYFLLILVYLVASLVTCTARRLPRALARLTRRAKLPASFDSLSLRAELGPAADPERLERSARRLGFRWRREDDVLYGRRRPYAPWGEILTHAGLVVIFVGAFFRLFGHRETLFVFEGQGIALPGEYGTAYELRADKVEEVRDADTGRVLEYRTAVRLLRGGEEVAAKEVEVNGPLRYAGLGVYQSNMDVAGASGLAVDAVKLAPGESMADAAAATFEWTLRKEKGTVALAPGQTAPLGDTGFQLRFLERYDHFVTDESGFRNDNPEYNPAAFVNVLSPSGAAAMGIIFELYPEFSIIKSSEQAFTDLPLTIKLEPGGGEIAGERREYVVVPEAAFVVGAGERMSVAFAAEGLAHRGGALTARLARPDGGKETFALPLGEWVTVALADGEYAFRFNGARPAALTGLTVSRDPGLTVFYVGCLLFSLGVAAAMLLSYDELFLYVRGGTAYLAGRSSKEPRLLRSAFERWAAKIKEGL